MGNMDVISVNLWQILVSLANLLILFLVLKKFLYKPVMNVLEARRAKIDGDYADADAAKRDALESKAQYEEKLSHAEADADAMRKAASDDAKRHGDKLVAEARERADGIIAAAEAEIDLEKKKARAEMKREIADVSVKLAEKIIERELDADTHRELIDSFTKEIGD